MFLCRPVSLHKPPAASGDAAAGMASLGLVQVPPAPCPLLIGAGRGAFAWGVPPPLLGLAITHAQFPFKPTHVCWKAPCRPGGARACPGMRAGAAHPSAARTGEGRRGAVGPVSVPHEPLRAWLFSFPRPPPKRLHGDSAAGPLRASSAGKRAPVNREPLVNRSVHGRTGHQAPGPAAPLDPLSGLPASFHSFLLVVGETARLPRPPGPLHPQPSPPRSPPPALALSGARSRCPQFPIPLPCRCYAAESAAGRCAVCRSDPPPANHAVPAACLTPSPPPLPPLRLITVYP